MRKAVLTLALASALAPSALLAYDVNKDLKNLGPDAHDIAIVLAGAETVTNTFDGYYLGHQFGGTFTPPTQTTTPTSTILHWQVFDDTDDNMINTGQTIHVGYSTQDHSSQITDMYWTDPAGNRIRGSVVYNTTANYICAGGRCRLVFRHDFHATADIRIRNLAVAVLPSPVPLPDLNRFNTALNEALRPVASQFTLLPGQEVLIDVPGTVPPGSAVVAVYEVLADGSAAESLDHVQFIANP